MNALKIIGMTVGCAAAGGVIGGWIGSRDQADSFGFSILFDGIAGMTIGGAVGLVVSAVLFAG